METEKDNQDSATANKMFDTNTKSTEFVPEEKIKQEIKEEPVDNSEAVDTETVFCTAKNTDRLSSEEELERDAEDSSDAFSPRLRKRCHSVTSTEDDGATTGESARTSLTNRATDTTQKHIYECLSCDYKTKKEAGWLRHEKKHYKAEMKCLHCGFQATSKGQLRRHETLLHLGGAIFACKTCEYETAFEKAFLRHQLVHEKIKCDQCDFETNRKDSLKRHQLTHLDEKLFRCKECDYSTNRRIHFKKHEDSHLPLYMCPNCDFQSHDREMMSSHELDHAKKKVYNCSSCGFGTNVKQFLILHELTHFKKTN